MKNDRRASGPGGQKENVFQPQDNPTARCLQVALRAHAAGISVIPPEQDGTKRPLGSSWKRWEQERPSEAQIRKWYAGGRTGVGFVCGAVSGHLEALDFESEEVYRAFQDAARATGLGNLLERIETSYIERSPGGGFHLLYRCEPAKPSTKLARRSGPPDEKGQPTIKTLIETKGEGGYIVVAPSCGNVHPSGEPYVLLRGGVETIATITPEEREQLWNLAKTFDEMPPREELSRRIQVPPGCERVANDFDAKTSWDDLLPRWGWKKVYERNGVGYWRRPGKEQGHSATTNYKGFDLLYVFSTSTPFEPERWYSKFAAYALMEHDGDFHAAARALAEQGYGAKSGSSADLEVKRIVASGARYDPALGREVELHKARQKRAALPVRDGLPYLVVGGQICHIKQTRYGPEVIPLASFNARIVADILRDDGAEQVRVFAIEGTLSTGEPLPRVEVPADRFSNMAWVAEKWGTRALVYAGQAVKEHLRVAIQHLSGEVPQKIVFVHLGWRRVNGAWVYLHGGGGIGAEGTVPEVDVAPEGRLADYVLPDPPAGDELRQAVRASLSLFDLAPDRITAPLQGATCLAPLGECIDLDFSIFLSGQTGVFKTELTALSQAHFGQRWSGRYLPANWASTANFLERLAFLTKDAVLVIDDFAPRGTQADVQALHRDADRILRAQGNRAGRGRLRSDATARPEYYPRGIILSSGEDVPRGHSLRPRIWIAEVSPGDVDVARLTEAQEAARQGMFARAMAAYIRWLAPQIDQLKEMLPRRRTELRVWAEGEHRRTPDVMAALALGWEVFLRFALEVGALTEQERDALWERVWIALGEGAAAQARHQESEEPVGMFLRLLAAAIASGRAHVADAKTGLAPANAERWGWRLRSGEYVPQGELVGWLQDEDLFLEPEAAYAAAQRLARDQGLSLTVTPRTLWKRAAERGALASRDVARKRNTVRKTIVGKEHPVVHISAEALSGEVGPTGGPQLAQAP
jgi:hypothetical protein